MTVDVIEALAQAPVILVLIYLIIRMQSEKEKLIAGLIELERDHTKALFTIIMTHEQPLPHPTEKAN